MEETNVKFEGENISPEALPKPSGWRILVGMLKIEKQSQGGIILTDDHIQGKEYLRSLARVLDVGEGAYQHDKFQGGIPLEMRSPKPWVKVGDIVLIGQYAGQSISILDPDTYEACSLKLLNDDEVLAVIPGECIVNA